ncbi:MAG: signal peptidase I [Gammaproteobacteria bacterium]|nr:signal peptidase I [Gammaproteobacteria bacterium]
MSNLVIAFDVPSILTALVLISGSIALLDIWVFSKKRPKDKKMPIWAEYARSFFPIFLLVLCIRSFLIQNYQVPTGSLAPTILPGDFIVVKEYSYGLRLPVLNTKIFKIGEPQRGDIALFRHPNNLKMLLVKRVIGLPGDHIVYRNKVLKINNDIIEQMPFGMALDIEGNGFAEPVQVKIEHLDQVVHKIFVRQGYKGWENTDVVVPPGSYFMMGDNRDNSGDSREWGFVPEANLVGKAFRITFSWDPERKSIRFDRVWEKIN